MEQIERTELETLSFNDDLVPRHVWIMETVHEFIKELPKEIDYIPKEEVAKLFKQAGLGTGETREIVSYVVAENRTSEKVEIYVGHATIEKEGGKVLRVKRASMNVCGVHDTLEEVVTNTMLNELRLEHDPDWKGTRLPSVRVNASDWREAWKGLKNAGMVEVFTTIFKGTKEPETLKVISGMETLLATDPKHEEQNLIKKYGKSRVLALKREIAKKQKRA